MTKIADAGLSMLKMRAERLLRLLEMDAPPYILCNEAVLVFRAACSLDPAFAGEALAKTLREFHAREAGVCIVCLDGWTSRDSRVCAACEAEMLLAEMELEGPEEDKPS